MSVLLKPIYNVTKRIAAIAIASDQLLHFIRSERWKMPGVENLPTKFLDAFQCARVYIPVGVIEVIQEFSVIKRITGKQRF